MPGQFQAVIIVITGELGNVLASMCPTADGKSAMLGLFCPVIMIPPPAGAVSIESRTPSAAVKDTNPCLISCY